MRKWLLLLNLIVKLTLLQGMKYFSTWLVEYSAKQLWPIVAVKFSSLWICCAGFLCIASVLWIDSDKNIGNWPRNKSVESIIFIQ